MQLTMSLQQFDRDMKHYNEKAAFRPVAEESMENLKKKRKHDVGQAIAGVAMPVVASQSVGDNEQPELGVGVTVVPSSQEANERQFDGINLSNRMASGELSGRGNKVRT